MNTFILILTAVSLAFYYIIVTVLPRPFKQTALFPSAVDVVGPRKQLWSVTRASIRQILGGIDTLLDGYQKVRWLEFYSVHLYLIYTVYASSAIPRAAQERRTNNSTRARALQDRHLGQAVLAHCSYTSTLSIVCVPMMLTTSSPVRTPWQAIRCI